jgi:SAM-dependent methyltransferase
MSLASIDPDAMSFDHFTPFYDDDYRAYDDDLDALAMLAAEFGDPLLELGCGTGRVLAPLAAAGHQITGVDISPALLAIAREKVRRAGAQPHAHLVEADLRGLALPQRDYAFAFCVSNTLMHFVTAEAQLAVLRAVHRHLRPGGRLLIDLFNPDVARLSAVDGMMELADRWEEAATGATVLKWSVRQVDWAEQVQETTFIYERTWPCGRSERTVCPFTLRFLWRHEAELMLAAAGFAVAEVWGDFDGEPYDSASPHLILLAEKLTLAQEIG